MILFQIGQLLLDVLHVDVVACRLGAEVGVASASVPVSFDRLGSLVDLDIEFFSQSVHDLPAAPELVCHVDAQDRAHLDFPLAAEHLCVRAADSQACLQTMEHKGLRVGSSVLVLTAY